MKFRLIALFALLSILLVACSYSGDITPPPGYVSPTPLPPIGQLYPANPPSVARGAAIYARECQNCHDENGLGNGPWASQMPVAVPAIGLREISSQSAPSDWYEFISRGKEEAGMPSYIALPEEQRWDVLAYVYSLGGTSEGLQNAAALYEANCVTCHGLEGNTNSSANFTDQQFMSNLTGITIYRAIMEGVAPEMPAFGTQLAEEDGWTLVSYLRSLTFAQPVPTATPSPTYTPEPPTPTVVTTDETTPAVETTPGTGTSESPTSTAEATATLAVQAGPVSGTVVSGSGAVLPAGLVVTLRGYDQDPAADMPQEVVALERPVFSDGTFEFENIEMPVGRIFLADLTYDGIPYQSDYVIVAEGDLSIALPSITIFESTEDTSSLKFDQVHVVLDFSTEGSVQVVELYVLTNPSQQAIVVTTDGTSIPIVALPEGASGASYQVAEGSAPFIGTETGFALLPSGTDQQYGLVAIYNLSYSKKLALAFPFALPTATVTIFVPEGIKVGGSQLTDNGTQVFQDTTYHLYGANDLSAGASLDVTISGKPKTASASTTPSLNSRTALIIGAGALGLALVATGIWLFIRDRRKAKEEELEDEEAENETEADDALGNDRDSLTDAIIALDDQYKAGGISKESYEKRREQLKARLKELL